MIEELKRRAREGDLQALQELRDRGFFGKAAAPRTYALSSAQRRMWILDQDAAARSAYNMPRALRIDGPLDDERLAAAFAAVVARHESLRTTFTLAGDEPRQVVHADIGFSVARQDLRGLPDPLGEAQRVAAEDAPRPFDLERGPLLRVHLLRTGDTEHVLLFNVHHIVCDAWSLDVIVQDLTAFYAGEMPPPLEIQYKDFAKWQNDRLASAESGGHRAYWRRALAGPLPLLDLPSDRARRATSARPAGQLTVDLGPALTGAIAAFSRQQGVALFPTLVALTKSLLHLESGQRDVIVGSPIAGRDNADLETQVGMFANAVALRDRVDASDSFAAVLSRVRATVEQALAHQEVPFDEIVNELSSRDSLRSPIFDVLVGLLNTERAALDLGALRLSEIDAATGVAPHDLVLYFVESNGTLHLSTLYRSDLFDAASVQRFADRFAGFAAAALADPSRPIGACAPAPAAFAADAPREHVTGGRTIALGALAQTIARGAAVSEAVVLPAPHDEGALVAFVVPGDQSSADALAKRVRAAAADSGAELIVYPVSAIPRLPDGRVHIRALEALRAADSAPAPRPPLHAWDLVPPAHRGAAAIATPAEEDAAPIEGEGVVAEGGPLLSSDEEPWTLPGALAAAAARTSDARLIFLGAGGHETRMTYAELLGDATRILGGLREAGCGAGDRAVLLLPEHIDVLPAFWGAVLGGIVPLVAAVPSDFGTPSRPLDHLLHIWQLLERPLLITTRALRPQVLLLAAHADVTPDRVVALEDLREAPPVRALHDANPDDIVFFSTTSGSTGAPKCVMLTHRNILARARGTNRLCDHRQDDVALNWLPFDHIGSLSDWHVRCVELACTAVYAPKEEVLGEPLRWLTLLDRYRATHSWAPNFAYALVIDALAARGGSQAAEWDLSCVRTLLTAGEAVTPAAVEAFLGRLAPFGLTPSAIRPAFGMAEMGSGVTYGRGGASSSPMRFHRIDRRTLTGTLEPAPGDPSAAAYADLGPPIPGVSIRIASDKGVVLPERRIGRLQIKGLPISKGYYRDADATRAVFFEDGWFDTGDYGFLSDGCLALTGRAKEGIIVSGANYSSAEIESVVESVDGVAVSFVAAAAVRGPGDADERLAVFFALDDRAAPDPADVMQRIREAVLERVGIRPDYLIAVGKEEIPKTAIGKIQRARLVKRFDAGDFDARVKDADRAAAGERTVPGWFAAKRWVAARPSAGAPLRARASVIGTRDVLEPGVAALRAAGIACTIVDGLAALLDALRPPAEGPRPDALLVVTTGGQIARPEDRLIDDRAAWAGIAASAAHELPGVSVRAVDIAGADVAAACLAELATIGGPPISAWRDGVRYIPALEAARLVDEPAGDQPFVAGGLYLVTGGTGGIGRRVVRHLVDECGALLLVVRGLGRGAEQDADAERSVRYRHADIADVASLERAVADAEAHFGVPMSGVVHLAGVAADRPLASETPESLQAILRPKALAAAALATIARTHCPTGVFVAFSSVNGLFGGAGAAAYSAANAWLDAIADDLRLHSSVRCWTIAWTMWDDVGMSRGFEMRDATRARGFAILRPDAAMLSLSALLRRAPSHTLVGVDPANPYVSPWFPDEAHALKAPAAEAVRVRPRTHIEQRVARIWEELLGIDDIGVHDHFIRLGGHSLKATQLAARMQKEFGGAIGLQDVFRLPTIEAQAAVIAGASGGAVAGIPPIPPAADYEVSHAQRRLWVIERMGVAGSAYHIAGATRIGGTLNTAALRASLDGLVARHEALRTTFVERDGEPRQIVREHVATSLAEIDLSTAGEPAEAAIAAIDAEARRPFDLVAGPLFRATLYRLADDDHVLFLTMHHIVSDGWSFDVIVEELFALYDAACRGEAAGLTPLRIQYKDFAHWHNAAIGEADTAGENPHRAFWLQQMSGQLPVVDLPADAPRPAVQTFRGATVDFSVDATTGRALRALARSEDATAFSAWLAVIRALLFRYTRAADAIVGTPVTGREHADLMGQVGFYVNMLPLRLRVDGGEPATVLVRRAGEVATGALTHQVYPYDRLVEELQLRRDMGRNPLFDVVLSVREHQPAPQGPAGVRTEPFEMTARTAKFDVTFFVAEQADGSWAGTIEYSTDLFSEARIRRMASHLATLAAGMAIEPDVAIGRLPLMPASERALVVDTFPFERSDYPSDRSVASAFEEVAARTPDAMAARSADGVLTYGELDATANGLACVLVDAGVRAEEPVGVVVTPSEWTAVALLGILKAGAAYVPLDPSWPDARIAMVLEDAGCARIVSDAALEAELAPRHPSMTFVDVRRAAADTGVVPPRATNGRSLAYIMFTSGSTGRPKGSLIEQRSILRLVRGANFLQLGEADRVLQAGSLAFDASTWEIWGPLLNGGCVCFPGTREVLDPGALGSLLRRWQITAMWCTGGLFNQMVDADVTLFAPLTHLLTGGERISMPHVRRFRAALPSVNLINGYGPTENTTFTACHTILDDRGEAPLGRPVSNTTVYVLDADLQPMPTGVPGEICAGGDGLARGYLNQPELTGERFVANPFAAGDRLYRTGDAGRWREDGTLEFAGRLDDQLKVRGFRVEPGEIEAVLRAHPSIRDAVVVSRGTSAGTLELLAYFTAEGTIPADALRAHLSATLPAYMVPAHIIQLERFPLNASNKVDRDALPAPVTATASAEIALPTTAEEAALAGIWRDLLGADAGIGDNYFELGGDSIRAIQMASRLRRRGWTMEVRDVFEHPTIAALARRIRPAGEPAAAGGNDAPGPVPMTAAQAWFFAHHQGDIHHFNQAVLLRPSRALDTTPLQAALSSLADHHDALRLTFPLADGRRQAWVRPRSAAAWLTTVDLRDDAAWPASMRAALDRMHGEFDLENGPLFRAALIETADGQRLWLAAHHLVVDGVSWRILIEQLQLAYAQADANGAVDLGTPPATFRDRAEETARFAASDLLTQETGYWRTVETSLPADARTSSYADAEPIAVSLPTDLTTTLLSGVHRVYGTEINDVLLAALARAMRAWNGESINAITLEGHGRERLLTDQDLSGTCGWFTSLFPFLLDANGDLRRDIRVTKESLRAVPRRGAGYGVWRYLAADDAVPPASPRLSFNYLGQFDESGDETLLAFASEPSGTAIAGSLSRRHAFDVTGLVSGGRLHLSILGDRADRPSAETLLGALASELRRLADHCAARLPEATPADFTSAVFDLETYDAFLADRGWSPASIADVCRATPMQQGLLVQTLLAPRSRAYHVQMTLRLSGALERDAFEAAWDAVCDAHPMLRSGFVHERLDQPLRIVFRERRPVFAWHDLRGLDPAARAARAAAEREADLDRGFDFERGGLMRFLVFRLDDARWEVVWSYHHVLLDGWSLGLVFADFARAYDALTSGAAGTLPPAANPADFVRWLEARAGGDAQAWWRRSLSGYDTPASLPAQGRAADGQPADAELAVDCDAALTTALQDTAARAGVTTATLIQAAWGTLLARYNRTDDVVFGTVVSGRPASLADADRMVGAFINTVPVRVRVPSEATLRDVVVELQRDLVDAEPFHFLPLAEVQDTTPLGRDLFDHLVVFENYPAEQRIAQAGQASRLRLDSLEAFDRTHYGFTLNVTPGARLALKFQYDARIHDPAFVARVADHYLTLLGAAAVSLDIDAHTADILPAAERARVTREFQPAPVPYEPSTVAALIARHAATRPDGIAVMFGHETLTYERLSTRAREVGDALRKAGAGCGAFVAILMERSAQLLPAVVGALESGAAYVPVDPGYPGARIDFMLADSGCRHVIADAVSVASSGERFARWATHDLGHGLTLYVAPDAGAAAGHATLDDPAYAIYTSGSTGRPKGVVVTHRALTNQIQWLVREFAIDAGDRMLQKTPTSFDASVWELFAPLATGATVVVAPPGAHTDPDLLGAIVQAQGITLLQLVPAQLSLMTQSGSLPPASNLRALFLGGEAVEPALLADLPAGRPFEVVNLYGPTEACINATFWRCGVDESPVPIGRPVANTRVYVLDDRLLPVPIGVPGEICIDGDNLALGYLGRDDLTAARFVRADAVGARVYRTGDLGRWRDDGALVFLGRLDEQIKIRGHRIEAGEVEAALRSHADVADAAVVASSASGAPELVAYVVPRDHTPLSTRALTAHLATTLPPAMIPSRVVALERLPLSPSGKVDRGALARRPLDVAHTPGDDAPVFSPHQTRVAAIWAGVLGQPPASADDDFFESGGHSLKAMQLASRIHRELGVRIALRDVFSHPRFSALATLVGEGERIAHSAIAKAPEQAHYALSHAQQRLWLLHHIPGGETAYNMPFAFRIEGGRLDAAALERALGALVRRHEALRTAFVTVDGEPRQQVLDTVAVPIAAIDLRKDTGAEMAARVIAEREAHVPFDLAAPPLLRATIVHLAGEDLLLLTIHHIIGDGWSSEVLLREVSALYLAFAEGRPDPLPSLRIQYKDFSEWQNRQTFAADEAWWVEAMEGAPDRIGVPFDFPARDDRDFRGAIAVEALDPATTAALRALASARGMTVSNAVLTLYMLSLYRLSGQADLVVGMSVANRNHADLERLIGFFVNVLPIRVRFSETMDLASLFTQVTAAVTDALEHQDYPFDLLVRRLNPQRTATRQPLLNVLYAFQNFTDVRVDLESPSDGGPALRPFDFSFRTSKFDLTLFVSDEGETLRFILEYDTGLFRPDTAKRHLALLSRFLRAAVAPQAEAQ